MNRLFTLPLIAVAAIQLSQIDGFSHAGLGALPLAILLGMLVGHWERGSSSERELAFTRFCQQRCLRAGIILLGLSVSFQQIAALGWMTLLLNGLMVSLIIGSGLLIGCRLLGLPRDLVLLISSGSAICGAAAVLATNASLKARQQHVTMAIATVVLFGTLAMFSYPLLFPLSGMSDSAYGVYIGSTVHEVAQAVAAGQSISPAVQDNALISKLIRVLLLAPFILLLGSWLNWREAVAAGSKPALVVPWFVFGFVALVGVNSVWDIPADLKQTCLELGGFGLTLAMAALGCQTRITLLRELGPKPLLLALSLFVILLSAGYALNRLFIG
ncbi:YeiH family protein [Neptuniibacter halophilus]|uniref:YeiH family protein n=1 Tax=Neptuniibacter halophilus TaxID=651666 RepID=UPI002573CE0B|nr:YeiH family protein [Neptuniibacter halophilus]